MLAKGGDGIEQFRLGLLKKSNTNASTEPPPSDKSTISASRTISTSKK